MEQQFVNLINKEQRKEAIVAVYNQIWKPARESGAKTRDEAEKIIGRLIADTKMNPAVFFDIQEDLAHWDDRTKFGVVYWAGSFRADEIYGTDEHGENIYGNLSWGMPIVHKYISEEYLEHMPLYLSDDELREIWGK